MTFAVANDIITKNKCRKETEEMNDKLRCCTFFGHRKIKGTDEVKRAVYNAVENLIKEKNVDIFLFGSKSDFDRLCYDIVTELKNKYPCIKRIYVRAEFPYIDESYREYLLERYEDTYYPENIVGAGRAVYVERNYEMINISNFCIVYYDKNYSPPKRKRGKSFSEIPSKSGTEIAYNYALKKCNVINVYD